MTRATAQGLVDFIQAGPSPFHCVDEVVRQLRAAGFIERIEENPSPTWQPGMCGFTVRGGSVIAWRAGSDAPAIAGFRILGAHTDSPNLRLKPRPDVAAHGWRQIGVEKYGGVLLSTWFDRDLGISGRVMVRGANGPEARLVRIDKPIARIPSLAIHLNRGANEGNKLDAQKHLPPVIGLGEGRTVFDLLQPEVGDAEILSFDLGLHDLMPATVGGADDEFIFAPRLDNEGSCYPAMTALLAAKTTRATQVIALFDHEEVGSLTWSGAAGPFLRQTLDRFIRNHAEQAQGGLERAIGSSWMVSADMAHAVHPNYIDRQEPLHTPRLNGGVCIKSNASNRYATDGESAALFLQAAADVGVPAQRYVVRSNMRCGTTIGPISAATLGLRTVDVGCPMLSMHSIREQAGSLDTVMMATVMERVLES